jgi:hypothetical protein
MGSPFDTTARPLPPNGAKPAAPPGKRDTTTNPFKIP